MGFAGIEKMQENIPKDIAKCSLNHTKIHGDFKGAQKQSCSQEILNDVYAEFVSVEYKTEGSFPVTVIREQDPIKGQRETCLYSKNNEINSEISGKLNIF